MTTRIAVALIASSIIVLPIWLGGPLYTVAALIVALSGGYEFYELLTKGGYHPAPLLGLVWIAALVLCGLQPDLSLQSTVLSAGFAITFVYAFFQQETPISTWLATSVVASYLGIMMAQVQAMRLLPDGLWWLVLGLLITWANDTAAYFVGSTVGRRKLWPRLSPKKTWEGTIAGWLGAAISGGVLAALLPLPIGVFGGIVLGFFGGILGLLGDLSISVLKRQVGVKDSGKLFPGHGGMLDRLDSVLFVLPFVYQVARWIIAH